MVFSSGDAVPGVDPMAETGAEQEVSIAFVIAITAVSEAAAAFAVSEAIAIS